MHIPDDKISQILAASDIVDVVSETVFLKKSGQNLFGLCPFHSEKSPSFSVNPAKQIFYCFGCHAGGNALAFIMKYHGISFPEAVKMLARKYSISIEFDMVDPLQRKKALERESLFRLNKRVMEYYFQRLKKASDSKEARKYLEQRQTTPYIIDKFYLGHAQDSWDSIISFFKKEKIGRKTAIESGLILPRKQGNGYYDRFRNRVIFPIFDINMQVAGFGGRIMDDGVPKYLNSPETIVYHKSKILYGLHASKQHCRNTGVVYIVEGYFDFLSLYQNGIKNCVATLGTALSEDHVRILKGYAKRMILVFDSDTAGLNAAKRSIRIFLNEGVDTRIMVLPKGSDPDSFIMANRHDPVSVWEKNAQNAKSSMEFLFDLSLQHHGFSVEGRLQILEEMKDYLVDITDRALRSLYVKQIAENLQIDEEAVLEKVRSKLKKNQIKKSVSMNVKGEINKSITGLQSDPREEQVISMMIFYPKFIQMVLDSKVLEFFYSERLRNIADIIINDQFDQHGSINDLLNRVEDSNDQELITSLSMAEHWDETQDIQQTAQALINRIIRVRKKNENPLVSEIIKAQKQGDGDVLELLRQKQQEIKQLYSN